MFFPYLTPSSFRKKHVSFWCGFLVHVFFKINVSVYVIFLWNIFAYDAYPNLGIVLPMCLKENFSKVPDGELH